MSEPPIPLEGERLELRYMRLDQAVLWDENPKQHDLGKLAAAIRRYGFQDPPKFDSTLGALIYGNGRTHALMWMHKQHEQMPRGILRDQEGYWYLPVKFGLDLESQAVARAFALDHNNLTMAGGEYSPLDIGRMWDEKAYTQMLRNLAEQNLLPVSVDGDDLDLLDAYVREAQDSTDGSNGAGEKAPFKDPDEMQAKWGVEPGQVWVIPSLMSKGIHRLMCGDTLDYGDMEQLLMGERAQGAVTSPPYAAQRAEKYGGPQPDRYLGWWEHVQANVRAVLADDGCFFVNIKEHSDNGQRLLYVKELVVAMVREWGWAWVDELCWIKPAMPGKLHYTFRNGFEPVFHFACEAKNFKFRPDHVKTVSQDVPVTRGPGHGERNWAKFQGQGEEFFPQGFDVGLARPSNVLSFPHFEPARGHPAVFPVELPEFFMRAYSDEGDCWVDPFVGAGSSVLAAERNKRVCFGMDLKPAYIAISLERLAELGMEPELA